ncbi:MAG: helix-turn-helix domain-containing protein [Planctomycetota bacterium]
MAATKVPTRRQILMAARAAEQDQSPGLTVAMLAEHAGVSEKHFQRAFKRVVGESPKKYVRRLRLQTAAYMLKWSDLPVTQIAMQAGFDTHAGFTKAFAKAYGLAPSDFRQASGVAPYLRRREEEDAAADAEISAATLDAQRLVVRIEQTPPTRIAAMRHTGPTEETSRVWPRFMEWADRRGLVKPDATFLGVHNDYWDPNAAGRYRYDAAVVVPDGFEPDGEAVTLVMPGGPVAKTEFRGSLADAEAAWRRFAEQWLPISGHGFRIHYAYDIYPASLVTGGALQRVVQSLVGIEATLCIPITP